MGRMRVSAGSGDCPITGLISARSNNRSEAARVPPSETAVAFVWQHLAVGGWLSSRIGPIGQIRRMRVSAGGGDCPVTGLISARPNKRIEAARVTPSETAVAFVSQRLAVGGPVSMQSSFANRVMPTACNGRLASFRVPPLAASLLASDGTPFPTLLQSGFAFLYENPGFPK